MPNISLTLFFISIRKLLPVIDCKGYVHCKMVHMYGYTEETCTIIIYYFPLQGEGLKSLSAL